jgi:hypothetical protein
VKHRETGARGVVGATPPDNPHSPVHHQARGGACAEDSQQSHHQRIRETTGAVHRRVGARRRSSG